jgi:predicted protein tyrosine phosphatase
MINPSAPSWIVKYFSERITFDPCKSKEALYEKIRASGFIFGHIIEIKSISSQNLIGLKNDELYKIAFLDSLFEMYLFKNPKEKDFRIFIEKVISFYYLLQKKQETFFSKIITSSNSSKLEAIFNIRIQTNKDIISKNFSHVITNALLFIDVLAFEVYLTTDSIPEKYTKKIEEIILNTISLSLKTKPKKTNNDTLMIRLFESSVRYAKFSDIEENNQLKNLRIDCLTNDFERYYLLDLANLSIWDDGILENEEIYFIQKLGENLLLSQQWIQQSIDFTSAFITINKAEISYFNYSNPVKHFYDQTTNGVIILIKRNKVRLTKELVESKELVYLLAKSTKRELTKEEKKKVKKQLLDVCKSIPSLTIFLLPGGGLLLPILVKFIPQLLPSAFNENLEDQ